MSAQTPKPTRYTVSSLGKGVLAATWAGEPYSFDRPRDKKFKFWDYNSYDVTCDGPLTFNFAVSRLPNVLVAGDLPRFGLGRILRNETACGPAMKLGDMRFRLHCNGDAVWLDETGTIEVLYHPWGTEHTITLDDIPGISLHLTAAPAGTNGIAVRITVSCIEEAACDGMALEIVCGGLNPSPEQWGPEWMTVDPDAESATTAKNEGNKTVLSHPEIACSCCVRTEPATLIPRVEEGHAFYTVPITKDGESAMLLAYAESDADESLYTPSDPAGELAEARDYFDRLLADVVIETPDPHIAAGFYASIINLEYLYVFPGWYEGLHGWRAYWSNNYQLSAATALSQFDRVRDAILKFGGQPDSAGWRFNADGSRHPGFPDAFPYFVLQLHRYWRATGDRETLDRVWQPACRTMDWYVEERDQDGNGLLDFHQGCNLVFYQADHMQLPGNATSPTLLAVQALRLMAELADVVAGTPGRADDWRRRATWMEQEALRQLWLADEGCFTGCRDTQNLVHKAAYYTDFVYPELCTQLPDDIKFASLRAMDKRLWIGSNLLRCGDFKPPAFGNDLPLPAQMCEAAEAYFRQGRTERGSSLLSGAGVASTVFTHSPGSVPELLSYTGRGRGVYTFGLPAGSMCYSVVAGLFGCFPAAADTTFLWQPAVPPDWDHAALGVPGFRVEVQGTAEKRTFRLNLEAPHPVAIRIPIYDCEPEEALANGHKLIPQIEQRETSWFACFRFNTTRQIDLQLKLNHLPREQEKYGSPKTARPELPAFPDETKRWLDVASLYNAHGIFGETFWDYELRTFDFCRVFDPRVSIVNGRLRFKNFEFELNPGTPQKMMAVGTPALDHATNRMVDRGLSATETIDVNANIHGVDWLMVAEVSSRLTDMQIGCVRLDYDKQEQDEIALVFGGNVDSASMTFATNVQAFRIAEDKAFAYIWRMPCDPARHLRSVTFQLYAFQCSLGIIAATVYEASSSMRS